MVESILPVASPTFLKRNKVDRKSADLTKLPHIFCERLKPDRVAFDGFVSIDVCISTNDVGSAREMCVQGLGWAMLPKYAIEPELMNKQLIPIGDKEYKDTKYGVWYLRERPHLVHHFESACKWLNGAGI